MLQHIESMPDATFPPNALAPSQTRGQEEKRPDVKSPSAGPQSAAKHKGRGAIPADQHSGHDKRHTN
ncbi:hypothetical protein R1CP_37360 (plasmid) [Rhodococcus opacus]|uniref:Uncharacterized protein n=1 Tax=Rhodococcus opacus TaxID=37919 RepID=A0A1B1KHJ0_RHOOP|nr:hypothetical protein R1CP_37360 [Rhodococcus opacus]